MSRYKAGCLFWLIAEIATVAMTIFRVILVIFVQRITLAIQSDHKSEEERCLWGF